MTNTWLKAVGIFVIFLFITFGAAAIGSMATIPVVDSEWFQTLAKPSFQPPDWVFSPVWTILYVLMAMAGALVWLTNDIRRKRAMIFFGVQLLLNVAWSILFFGMQKVGLAFVDIVLLWIAIAATIGIFYTIKPITGWLLTPYLLWVSFASILNFSIMILN